MDYKKLIKEWSKIITGKMRGITLFLFCLPLIFGAMSGCGSSGGESSVQPEDQKKNDALLSNLIISSGELSPAFNPKSTEYTLATRDNEITFTALGADTLMVDVNGVPIIINEQSSIFYPNEGDNLYEIIVSHSSNSDFIIYRVNVTLQSEVPIQVDRGPVPDLYEGVEVGAVDDFIDNHGNATSVDQLIEMHISMDVGSTDFCDGFTSAHLPSTTWGFNINDGREKNNSILGPTLKLLKGKNYRIHVTNNLHDGDVNAVGIGEKSTVHWHGLSLLGDKDGGPHQMINSSYAPDALDHKGQVNPTTWTVDIPMVNDSASFWYHPHAEGITSQHVYNGLAGMMIVKNPNQTPDIPNTYGVDDFPVVLQDKGLGDISLRSNNVSETMADSDDCVLDEDGNVGTIENAYRGAAQVVNGQYKAEFNFPQQVVRLRILNGSAARSYNVGIEDANGTALPFHHIATDGGLLSTPNEQGRLLMYGGERNEILLDLSNTVKGTTYTVKSYGEELDLISLGLDDRNIDITGDQDNLDTQNYDLFQFTVGDRVEINPVLTVASNLRPILPMERLNPEDATQYSLSNPRNILLQNTNGIEYNDSGRVAKMDMSVINLSPQYGATEVWRVTANSALRLSHPFHVHDGSFQVIKRLVKNDDLSEGAQLPLTSAETGWKDVVQIREDEYLYIIKEFSFYAHAESPFMLHCHVLPHEDEGMMGQWTVIE
jgi:FtsP/CotA-like multicopper oxidase with cupredoxin domain